MMKKLTSLALAFGLSLTAAQAADLTTMRRVPSVTAAPASSWTGLYLGAFGGGVFGGRSYSDGARSDRGFNAIGGVLVGLQGGYDVQAGKMVYGAAFDVAYSTAQQAITGTAANANFFRQGSTNTAYMPFLASARLRAGYLMTPDWLLYATGGLAIGSTRYRIEAPGATNLNRDTTHTSVGWTLGVGTEYKITQNWTANLEYRFVSLGAYATGAQVNAATGVSPVGTVYPTAHTVRLGANYRF